LAEASSVKLFAGVPDRPSWALIAFSSDITRP
jgi:hypothetical protein